MVFSFIVVVVVVAALYILFTHYTRLVAGICVKHGSVGQDRTDYAITNQEVVFRLEVLNCSMC